MTDIHETTDGSPSVQFDFDKYPTLLRMWQSKAKFKVVIGPAGSAKTSGIIAMLLLRAMTQAPHRGVRSLRVLVARQSYQMLAKSTVQSLINVLGAVGTFTDSKPPRGHAAFPLPDGTTVEMDFVFLALDGENVAGDLRGLEASIGFIDEISESTDDDLINLFISRLGRYPSAMAGGCTGGGECLAATNGPREGHWLHKWSLGERDVQFAEIARHTGQVYFELFRQPPALLRPKREGDPWTPNPKAENVENLPSGYGYYFAMLSLSEAHIQAFVEGEFAAIKAGKVVYPGFGKLHILPRAQFDRLWSRGNLLYTFDFGRTPVMLLAVERADGGLIVIDEIVEEGVSIDVFWEESAAPVLRAKYGQCRIAGATGDPAGMDLGGTTETSPFQILQGKGVPIEPPQGARLDRLAPRIEATRNRMARLGVTGAPMLQITDNCVKLLDAIQRTYVYQEVRGQVGVVSDVPTKSHKNWCSDLANALEYLCLYRSSELESARSDGDPGERRRQPPLLGG